MFDDDPMAAMDDVRRLLTALLAVQGLEWDGAVLSRGTATPLPFVIDHRYKVHVKDAGGNG